MMKRCLILCACAGLLLGSASLVAAGPNAGGTLILHADPSLVYTDGTQSWCGRTTLTACSLAVTSVPWQNGTPNVFHVLAAFPPESEPRLKGLTFGVDYDSTKFVLMSQGNCADFEIADPRWPRPHSGTGQSWTTAQTGPLTEVYWFVGYAYSEQTPDSTALALIPHPVQGGAFVDDAAPGVVDPISQYGRLGFGQSSFPPCPPGSDGPDGPGGGNPPSTGDPEEGMSEERIIDVDLQR
jgi:hypothetical protein